jgi:NadR type nicotinamide-nucleotide adenylyltransferase
MKHGFIVGKFYPPHAGHHLIVRTAARVCEHVTVAVLASSQESIPLDLRVAWMREEHAGEKNVAIEGAMDEVRVDYDDPAIWDAHMAIMLEVASRSNAGPVDCVFTSEPYGEELARRFGARNVCLDLSRVLVPISGTAARRDYRAAWPFLSAPVRVALSKRVIIAGAESTGKTTLAHELAEHYGTRAVPEYGREYSLLKLAEHYARAALNGQPRPPIETMPWSTEDFLAIAREQQRREELAAREHALLIADTDAFATAIWHERYLGKRSALVEAIGSRAPAMYLLTHHKDVPFAQDGTRDGEQIRAWMTARFVARLEEMGHPWMWLRGEREPRKRAAIDAINRVLAAGQLTAPL